MTKPTTPEEVAALAAKGTQGEWSYKTGPSLKGRYHTVMDAEESFIICEAYDDEADNEPNAKRIASVPAMEALIAEQAAQLAAANARIAELGGALEPFAKAGGLFNDHFISLVYDPAAGDEYRLNSSHLIAARAALSQTDKGEARF